MGRKKPCQEKETKKILALIERGDFKLEIVSKSKLPKSTWGTCHKKKRTIRIWKKLAIHAHVLFFIHECLHLLYPEKPEEWVGPRAYRVWGFASRSDDYRKILSYLEANCG